MNDYVTQQLMVNFYEKWLGGMSKREAFMNAQLSVKEEFPSPYFWGAFVMVGE